MISREPAQQERATSGAVPRASSNGLTLLNTTSLPAPTGADIAEGVKRRLDARSFDAFYGYALSQAETDPLEAPMRSAMLLDPSSLEPVRQDCGALPPAVLIDLDPPGGVYDAQTAWRGKQALAEVTAALRAREVQIAWISGQDDAAASPIRGRLGAAGLDPYGKDQLLLFTDELLTKQMLRANLAKSSCIIAIAGDSREDFDELYTYLKTPEAALPLDEFIGAGWFLTPTPID